MSDLPKSVEICEKGPREGLQILISIDISRANLPEGYTVKWDGQFNEMKVAQGKLMVIVPLTILVIFLLLYSTFGNFKDALMVVLNVPFAAIGGLLALAVLRIYQGW